MGCLTQKFSYAIGPVMLTVMMVAAMVAITAVTSVVIMVVTVVIMVVMNTALMESIQLKANVMAFTNAHMVTDILISTVQKVFSSMDKSVIGQKMSIVKTK